MASAFKPTMREAEAVVLCEFKTSLSDRHSKFQDSLDDTVRPCLKGQQ